MGLTGCRVIQLPLWEPRRILIVNFVPGLQSELTRGVTYCEVRREVTVILAVPKNFMFFCS